MHRYLSILWDATDQRGAATAANLSRRIRALCADWVSACEEPGLRLFTKGEQGPQACVHLLKSQVGAVVGTLFQTGFGARSLFLANLDENQSRDIFESRGKHLIDRFWGAYVAFIYDQPHRKHYILRDPTGGLPCFTLSHDGVQLVFSSVEDVAELGCVPFSVNWHYVAAFLMFEYLRVRETGLVGVTEVQAGECLTLERDSMVSAFHWDPRDIQRENSTEIFQEAATILRETMLDCVGAWASCYRHIIHELSGGLDSSIIAGCLARAPARPTVTCVNFSSARPEDSESSFAQMAASHAGFELVQKTLQSSEMRFERVLNIPKLVSPHVYMIGRLGHDEGCTELANQRNADVFFSGQGGDHIFHQNPTSLTAADYVFRHGIRKGLWPVIVEAASLSKESIWAVCRQAAKHGLLRRPILPLSEIKWSHSFLSEELLSTLTHLDILHPWLREPRGVAPEKFNQIANLVSLQGHYVPFGRVDRADVVYPIFSQPVVEHCLRTPTYVLTAGARDRAVARRAFVDIVPAPILARHSKADVTNFYNNIVSRNADMVRELLLDGQLIKQGVINRPKLEQHLSPQYLIRGDQICDVFGYIAAEIWARSWGNIRLRAAA